MQQDATGQDCQTPEGIVMTNPQTASSFTASGPGFAPTGSIFFAGSATMVIRYDGFTILTDPAFNRRGEQTWLGHGQMATRLIDPAITTADLPFVDMILLSGYCGDHFDARAEQELEKVSSSSRLLTQQPMWRNVASTASKPCRAGSHSRSRMAIASSL
jgi:hypothetical protein